MGGEISLHDQTLSQSSISPCLYNERTCFSPPRVSVAPPRQHHWPAVWLLRVIFYSAKLSRPTYHLVAEKPTNQLARTESGESNTSFLNQSIQSSLWMVIPQKLMNRNLQMYPSFRLEPLTKFSCHAGREMKSDKSR